MRRDAPFILRVSGDDPFSKPTVEIAAALEEQNGLAEQQAGERVACGKGSEYKKAVRRDAEQCIDLLAVDIRSEFHVVIAAAGCERIVTLIIVLIGILRACNRIA